MGVPILARPRGWCPQSPRGSCDTRGMAGLQPMPAVAFTPADLKRFGDRWTEKGGALSRSRPESSLEFGELFDARVGEALAQMLGGIPIVKPSSTQLTPAQPDS